MLTYSILLKHPTSFKILTGLSLSEFQEVVRKTKPKWDKLMKAKEAKGRPHGVGGLENHIFVLLVYYRVYVTQAFIGVMYGVDDATIYRTIHRAEKIVVKAIHIKKERTISQVELETIIVDCTEQPIERPKKGQKPYYSGKKKKHTIKTKIVIKKESGKKSRIVSVSKSHPGSVHDYNIRKQEKPFHRDVRVYGDSAYEGLHNVHKETETPYKKPKKGELNQEQKEYNTAVSRYRIAVEHTIGQIKKFKIASERYRGRRKRYNLKVNLIAGIVNFQAGH